MVDAAERPEHAGDVGLNVGVGRSVREPLGIGDGPEPVGVPCHDGHVGPAVAGKTGRGKADPGRTSEHDDDMACERQSRHGSGGNCELW